MRFGDLTYPEIRRHAAEGWLAIVPTGCTEQQGPHLPVDFDTWFVEQLCVAASEMAAVRFDVRSLVMPTLPFGPTPEHRGFGSGYVDIPQPVFEAVVGAVLDSLVAQGFRRILVWRGCGGHRLRAFVDGFNAQYRGRAQASLPGLPYHDIWCRIADASVPGGHADSFATSIALHLRPHAVRRERIEDPENLPVDWEDPNLDFARSSRTGVIGDPTAASAELGAALWRACVTRAARVIGDCGRGGGVVGPSDGVLDTV